MKYLVTGRAGSGKSAVAKELQSRNYEAYDTDAISGLSSWEDLQTGKLVKLEDNRFVDLDKYEWVWDKQKLLGFIANKEQLFICGGAGNDLDFEGYFDKHFVLAVSPVVQQRRLTTRTENDYGQDPAMHQRILQGQRQHVAEAIKLGAIQIDAEQPIAQVVDQILENVDE